MSSLPAADLLRLAASPPASGSCLDELELAQLAQGGIEAAVRATAVRHLAGCEKCRRQLAAVSSLLDDPEIAGEVERSTRSPLGRMPRLYAALGLAAAAALAFIVFTISPGTDRAVERDPAITAANAPMPIGPLGTVPGASALTWTRVDGASSYRAILFDATGTVLFESQLADTTVAIPDSVRLIPNQRYFWKVEARTGWDRWTPSDLQEFQVAPAGKPQAAHSAPDPPGPVSSAPALTPDTLPSLISRLSDKQLADQIRTSSVDVRNAFRDAIAGATRGDSLSRMNQLRAARRLAEAYRTAWEDSFLLREIARFTAWSPRQRTDKVWADSARVAGAGAYGREGPRAAIAVWRQALARARKVPDSAGIAALSGNIGAALAREAEDDSARVYLTSAERLALAAGDLRVTANAISELAGLSERRGDIDLARAQYAQAMALREKIGDPRGLASDYNNIASLSRAAGEPEQARQHLEAALALNRRDRRLAQAATNLVNLASLAASVGALSRAEEDYREALSLWTATGDTAEAASALEGLGEVRLRRGDYPAAVESFAAAVNILERTGPAAELLAVRHRMAAALAAQGRLQEALGELRDAGRMAEAVRAGPEARAGNMLARADLALQLNQYQEAEAMYQRAVALYLTARRSDGAAAARHGLGMLYLAQENFGQATALLEAALQEQISLRDRRGTAITRLALGETVAQAGDTTRARRAFERASAEFSRLGDPVASAAALSQLAELESAGRRFAAAESLYRTASSRLGSRTVPDIRWRIHAGLAEVRANLGDREAAARELRASIAQIELQGASLRLPERRSGLLSDKWEVYQRLAALELGRGRIDASLAVSEELRAREMVELLSLGRIAAPRDTAADLIAREQDLRRRIGELTRGLETEAPDRRLIRGPDVARAGPALREGLLQAQASYAALRLEIRERAPGHAALVAPAAITWRAVAQQLRPDEAMLEYLLSEAGSFVYIITRDTLAAIPLRVTQHELARRVDFARGTLQPRGVALDSLWRAPLRQLHRDLIAPVERTGLLSGKSRLIIVPHAELHYLPFAALIEGDGPSRFLIQRYRLSFTPSASVWTSLGNRGARRAASGLLALAPNLDRLPASRREIAAIARMSRGKARVLTGRDASESAFRQEAPTHRVIHLATYGVLNKENPLFSFVDLAADARQDGRLEAHEIFGVSLAADLVVLAACQTALASGTQSDVPAGDDWVGLSRAFLTAGARQVVASLWAVQDQATATLMQRFYEGYEVGADPAGLLAEAQRALLALPGTAHPYYWAGFEVIGRR